MRIHSFILSLLLLIPLASMARVELHEFDNEQQHQLYKKLSEQLRCLVCQNQNLADSNAELAQDMRQKTYQMVMENKSEDEIIQYWVARYGDFVLYNPPFKYNTLILWLGPFVLFVMAFYFGKKIIQSSNADTHVQEDASKHQLARQLLENSQRQQTQQRHSEPTEDKKKV